jgi:hypothetical protein
MHTAHCTSVAFILLMRVNFQFKNARISNIKSDQNENFLSYDVTQQKFLLFTYPENY